MIDKKTSNPFCASELTFKEGQPEYNPNCTVTLPEKDHAVLDCMVPENDLEQVLTEEKRKVARKRYISDKVGEAYKGWGNGRVVFDAGTGTGKTSFIINQLLPWAMERTAKEKRLIKILVFCNRVSLKSQDIRKIIESGFGIDLTQFDNLDDLDKMELDASNSRFIRVWTYQKIEHWQHRKPEWVEKWLDSYTYIVCDEAHYFFADAGFNSTTELSFQCIERLVSKKVVIYMSATGQLLFDRWKEDGSFPPERYYYMKKNYDHISMVYFFYRDAERQDVLDHLPKGEKAVVFVTKRDTLVEMKKKYDGSASYYCSPNNKDGPMDQLEDCINPDGTLCKRILFTTTALYNGVDIKDRALKHLIIEQWDPLEVIQEIGRKRPLDVEDTCKLYLRGKGRAELLPLFKKVSEKWEPAVFYRDGGEAWKRYCSKYDIDDRLSKDSVVRFSHKEQAYHVNKMKLMLYDYQRNILWPMYAYTQGYEKVMLHFIDENLYHRTEQYPMDDLAAYIAEHMGQPMTKKEIRQNVSARAQLEAKPGRAKSEGATMAAVEEELERYDVQIVKYGKRKHQKGELQYYTFEESEWAKFCAFLIA